MFFLPPKIAPDDASLPTILYIPEMIRAKMEAGRMWFVIALPHPMSCKVNIRHLYIYHKLYIR